MLMLHGTDGLYRIYYSDVTFLYLFNILAGSKSNKKLGIGIEVFERSLEINIRLLFLFLCLFPFLLSSFSSIWLEAVTKELLASVLSLGSVNGSFISIVELFDCWVTFIEDVWTIVEACDVACEFNFGVEFELDWIIEGETGTKLLLFAFALRELLKN